MLVREEMGGTPPTAFSCVAATTTELPVPFAIVGKLARQPRPIRFACCTACCYQSNMWTKICGITNLTDAETLAASAADAIGLNFYAPSKRYVAPATAAKIRELVGDRLEVVGVFVNSTAAEVAAICQQVGLDTVQFHGDESAQLIAEFHQLAQDIKIIRAYRVSPEGFSKVEQSLAELDAVGVPLKAVLVDAYKPGEFGGTGHQINPELVRDWSSPKNVPVILAGGLRPDNVASAVEIAGPWGVDTASGVEIQPGVKSAAKIQEFVAEARSSRD